MDNTKARQGRLGNSVELTAQVVQSGLDLITNGQTQHKTPVPPPSDVAELEFVSALHQSDSMQELRHDASITAAEIALFLKSRHGIEVDPETVRTVILEDGLTADINDEEEKSSGDGGDIDNSGGVMDLVELTSALMIPNLLRLRRKKADERAFRKAKGKGRTLMSSITRPSKRRHRQHDSNGPDQSSADEAIGNGGPKDDVQILSDVLSLMLEDCTGDGAPKPLDDDLVRDLLCGYGEIALAKDESLVKEMVAVATTDRPSAAVGTGGTLLDGEAFLEALTSDVNRKHDPGRDERHSTNFEDVWHYSSSEDGGVTSSACWDEETVAPKRVILKQQNLLDAVNGKFCRTACKRGDRRNGGKAQEMEEASKDSSPANNSDNGTVVPRLYTAQSIDYAVDNYRWRVHFVLLWLGFIAFTFSYLLGSGGYVYRSSCRTNDSTNSTLSAEDAVLCPLVGGIVIQLLRMLEFIIFGTPFILLASVGNSIEGREPLHQVFGGIVLFAVLIFVFYFADFSVPYWIDSNGRDQWIQHITIVFSVVVLLMQILNAFMLLCKRKFPHSGWYQRYFRRGLVRYEAQIKRGALFKIDRMLCNAHSVHKHVRRRNQLSSVSSVKVGKRFLSNFGLALDHYVKLDGEMTTTGGVHWTWKKIWNKTLFTEEGIWISGRLVAGTVLQWLVICAIPILAAFLLPELLHQVDEQYETDLAQNGTLVLGIGATAGFLAAIIVTILFIPTTVATILKFRRGALPSLHSAEFLRCRFAQDQAALLFGGMVWGVVFSFGAIALIFGGFVYLLLWDRTRPVLLGLIGQLIGVSIIVLLRLVVMQIFRASQYSAFYRKKPFGANILTVVMECYSIGISLWFMIVRLIKLLVLAALYLGRIDTPFLASGVGIFASIELDNWPTVSRQEILLHEAHRHPYLETLGYLYMMQLKHQNGFAIRACSAWRLLFVLAIMPWMHKYRDMTRPEHFGGEEDAHQDDRYSALYSLDVSQPRSKRVLSASSSSRLLAQSMVSPRWQMQLEAIKNGSCTSIGSNAPPSGSLGGCVVPE